MLEALVALVAEHAPLVLLLDDLQWADPQTIAAIGYLRRRGVGLAGAIVATARTTETPPDHPLRRLAPDTVVRLEPLSPSELTPIGIPDLHDSTGGNPRFVVEALANGRPNGPSQSLTEALLSQCRAEGPYGYRVLVAASLLEQPFEPEPLADLLGIDAAELTEELERLCERRILRIDGLRFRFRYDVVGQVLFASISPARRRLLQQRLGSRIAAGGPVPISQTMGSPEGMTKVHPQHDLSGTVFEGSDEAAYVMDPEQNRILAANDAGCALLGYTREELLEIPISCIHPSELPELSQLLERVLRYGRASTITLTCRTKQGTFLPTEISLHGLEIDGRLRILGLVQDRSEHRQPPPDQEPFFERSA